MLRERIAKALGSEDPEKVKLNADEEYWDVMGVQWSLKSRIVNILYPGVDYDIIKGVHEVLCDKLDQTVRGRSFGNDMEVEFFFELPHRGYFDKEKGILRVVWEG